MVMSQYADATEPPPLVSTTHDDGSATVATMLVTVEPKPVQSLVVYVVIDHVEKPGGSEAGGADGGSAAPSPHVKNNADDGPVVMQIPVGFANAGSGFEQLLTPWW